MRKKIKLKIKKIAARIISYCQLFFFKLIKKYKQLKFFEDSDLIRNCHHVRSSSSRILKQSGILPLYSQHLLIM